MGNQSDVLAPRQVGFAALQHPSAPSGHLFGLFPGGRARWYGAVPDHPVWIVALCADLGRGQTLVPAVVPLQKVVQVLVRVEPGELGGVTRPLQRAASDITEGVAGQMRRQGCSRLPPVVGQGDICSARVLSRHTPLGLPVSEQHNACHEGLLCHL